MESSYPAKKLDVEKRRREKQAAREADDAEVAAARREGRKPSIANGVFSALDARNVRIEYPSSRRKA
jgi:hypothetical protein